MMNQQNNGMQKRMLIMTLVVFVFFIAYEFLVLKPQQEEKAKQAQIAKEQQENSAPKVISNDTVVNPASSKEEMAKSISSLSSKAIAKSEILTTIKTNKNIIEIDKFGRVAQVTLLESKYVDENGEQIRLFDANDLRPLEVRFGNVEINTQAFKTPYLASSSNIDATLSEQTLTLTQNLNGTTLTKELKFYPSGKYDINVKSTNNETFFITNGEGPNVSQSNMGEMVVHGVIVKLSDGTLTVVEDGDADKNLNLVGAKFVSNFDKYYATLVYNFEKPLAVTIMPDKEENPQSFIHGNSNITLHGYIGPKEHVVLNAIDPELTDAIEYGWFTFIAKPVFTFLQWIHSYVGNWGWAIVILTIVIKLILYPLSYKGMVSMNKLKELAPKMKEIQAKYKDDKQRQSAAMMELYKKHGANPMGGCLPLILQIPVFFAIYRVLLNSIELKGADWIFWIEDLAVMDPYFVLPILMGASMYLQQKITPNTMQDEMQRKIFQMLPVVFTFFFLWFPAGLTLYWFVNNVFTISQQYYINRLFDKQRAAKK